MGGGTKTVTQQTTQKTDPYAPAQPALQTILNSADYIFRQGVGGNVYQGERVAGLGDTTQAGLDYLVGTATAGLPGARAAEALNTGLLTGGGATVGTQEAAQAYRSVGGVDTSPTASLLASTADPNSLAAQIITRLGSGAFDNATGGQVQGLLDATRGPTQTEQSLRDVAAGKYLGGANPYLDAIAKRSSDQAAASVAGRFAASGRYGSGMFSNAIADAVSANEDRLRYQDYDAERARQERAAGAIDAAAATRTGQQAGLLQQLGGIGAQNAALATQAATLDQSRRGQALSAAGQLAGQEATNAGLDASRAAGLAGIAAGDRAAGMGAIGNLPGISSATLAPGQTLAQAGAIQDAERQDRINAAMQGFEDAEAAPWKSIGLYSSVATPIAGLGSSSVGTSTQQVPQPGLFQQILGGGLSTLGILGRSGSGSILGSLFSDERIKEDVEPVGKLHDGQTVYSYRMAGDPRTQIGLLAQDVASARPEAVSRGPQGLLMVDYKAATARAARKGKR